MEGSETSLAIRSFRLTVCCTVIARCLAGVTWLLLVSFSPHYPFGLQLLAEGLAACPIESESRLG